MKYFAFLLLVGVTVLVSACQPEAELYTEEKAIAAANWHLAEYAEQQHVPIAEFKGPYVKKSLGLDFPTYIVFYKHPEHFFRYAHWIGRVSAAPFSEIKRESGNEHVLNLQRMFEEEDWVAQP